MSSNVKKYSKERNAKRDKKDENERTKSNKKLFLWSKGSEPSPKKKNRSFGFLTLST